jgi:DNA-binding NtrC family response regulator
MQEMDGLVEEIPAPMHSRWAQLTVLQTKVRFLQASGAWVDADIETSVAIAAAIGQSDTYWANRFSLHRIKGLAALGKLDEAAGVVSQLNPQPMNVDLIIHRERVLGYAALAAGRRIEGERLMARADRISLASGNPSGRDSYLERTLATLGSVRASDHSGAAPPDLDTAVALIELGGHAHILAREALAAVDAAGCARGAAIVALATDGPRLIDHRGWDPRAALSAARKPAGFEVIPVGRHRDEPWQLVIDPHPELEHRCTLIAIRKLVNTALTLDRHRRDEQQRAALWPAEALDGDPESIWASEQMSEVLGVARRIAPTPLSVLITGETGTGKEMLARAIHRASDRADRPLLPFNCTAVPRDMIESQLFGFRKGAFTGADANFAGVIRSAAGGTLFLDEIAEVPVDVQPKLLRFLETHEIHPLGEPQPIKVDVRVIAATNARLEQLVAEGRFREDLFYRLNVVQLRLPPLRERREEIPPLVEHYLRKHGDELKKGRLTLSDETLEYLLLYSWPGNLRQLANEVRRMVAMAEPDSTLTPAQLSQEIQASRRTIPATPVADAEVRVRIDQPLPAAVEILEQTMVKSALDRTHGRVEEAARMLGISRKGLFLKRRRWGLSH